MSMSLLYNVNVMYACPLWHMPHAFWVWNNLATTFSPTLRTNTRSKRVEPPVDSGQLL